MKKLLFITLVVTAGVYLYQNPGTWQQVTQIGQGIPDTIGIKSGSSVVYKWKDRDGTLVVSTTPPDDDTEYEKTEYDHDTNVIPALAPEPDGENKK